MRKALLIGFFISLATSTSAFEISFNWDGLKSCNTGFPNTVGNPVFTLKDVPKDTKFIRFRLIDRDAIGYNHGTGVVEYSGQNKIPADVFKYKSPCPPDGVHRYEWSATAQTKKNGGKLDVARALRNYPD